MHFGFGTITNTTINANGKSVTFQNNSFGPWGSCTSYGGFYPGCFGYGYNSPNDIMLGGVAFGAGYALGGACIGILPELVKGIGQGCEWAWNSVIQPGGTWLWENAIQPGFGKVKEGASWLWDKAIVPGAKGVWSGIKSAGNFVWNGIKAIGGGIKNLWNNIFHKE